MFSYVFYKASPRAALQEHINQLDVLNENELRTATRSHHVSSRPRKRNTQCTVALDISKYGTNQGIEW